MQMVTTDPKTEVDESPIVVSEIVVDGRRLVAREPLRFEVEFDDDVEEPLFTLEGRVRHHRVRVYARDVDRRAARHIGDSCGGSSSALIL